MKTRKVILNDDGKTMTKKQAEKAASAFIAQEAGAAWARGDDDLTSIEFNNPVENDSDVTLHDLLTLANS